ncbi:MAG: hypothetical protein Q9168_002206 [Polycauliona sp. 1 TL-2023]
MLQLEPAAFSTTLKVLFLTGTPLRKDSNDLSAITDALATDDWQTDPELGMLDLTPDENRKLKATFGKVKGTIDPATKDVTSKLRATLPKIMIHRTDTGNTLDGLKHLLPELNDVYFDCLFSMVWLPYTGVDAFHLQGAFYAVTADQAVRIKKF